MKNSILIMALALLTFSCNTEEIAEPIEQNLTLENSRNSIESIELLLSNQEFREFINSRQNQRNSGNGVMLLDDGFGLFFVADDGVNQYFLGGVGEIEALPNNRARFSIHTNSPFAFVSDLATFNLLYSSSCLEGNLGRINYNYISEYETIVFEPIPGVIFTFYQPTGVNASRQVVNGHCDMSDAQEIYDENFELVGCTEATEYRTLRIRPNGNEGSIITLE